MQKLSLELKTAIEAAKAGAKIALKYYDKKIDVQIKADNTVLTIADKETEKAIKEFILSKFPNAKFVAEESGGTIDNDEFWIIDPIDATRSFSRGIPTWNVLIALCRKEEIILGVSYFPALNSILYAEKGKGTYLNGKRVYVSKINTVKDSYVAYGSPRFFKDKKRLINLIEKAGSTRCPDTTYSSFLLAQGKYDAVVDEYAQLWDAAPLSVIIEEAGGRMTNFKGKPWKITDRGYIASNGLIHNEIVSIVNEGT